MSWVQTVVDSIGDVGRRPSVALDSNDNPHVVYEDYGDSQLKYAHYDGSSWHTQTIYNEGSHGQIAMDSGDNIHIIFSDNTTYYPNYAYYDGSSWTFNTIESEQVVGIGGIAIDNGDIVHVVYYMVSYKNEARYKTWDGSSWTDKGTIGGADYMNVEDLCIMDNGHPGVVYFRSYYNPTVYTIGYAEYYNSSWTLEHIKDISEDVRASLVSDGSGYPHIAYSCFDDITLHYMHYDGSSWNDSIVDNHTTPSDHIVIVSSKVHSYSYYVAYEYLNDLYFASYDGSDWAISGGSDDFNSILTFDMDVIESNEPIIVAYDSGADDLIYFYGEGEGDITSSGHIRAIRGGC